VLNIGCSFDFDNGLLTSWEGGESWYYVDGGGVRLWIPLLRMQASYLFIC